MDIPLVSSLPLAGIGGTTAVAPVRPAAVEQAAILAAPPPALTTVDLSPLGRFLSAASLFQKKMLELQVSASNIPESQAAQSSAIAIATSTFAVAFNELQASGIGGTDVNADTLEQQSLASLFAQRFGARTAAAGGDEDSALDSLASIGLSLNPDGRMSVDLPLLQVALEVDPATTTALLARAGSAFGTLAEAGVAPADLLADAEPPASTLAQEVADPGTAGQPSRDAALQQEPRADNVAAPVVARQDNTGAPVPAASAPATPAAAPGERLLNDTQAPAPAVPNPVAVEAREASSNAQIAAADAQAARSAAAQQARDTNAPAAPEARSAEAQTLVNISSNAATPAVPANPATPAVAPAQVAPATPATQAIPAIPATPAVQATPESDPLAVANQAAATPVTRVLAERTLADRAVELAENKRTQSASEEERAELAGRIEMQDRMKAEQLKVDNKAEELQRQQREAAAQQLAAANAPMAAPTTATANPALPAAPPAEGRVVAEARPPVSLNNNAQQLARDPAIAAAIAAYSLNTAPFAALNARQELAAPRFKTIPAVSNVDRIAPIEPQATPKDGTR